MQVLPLGTKMGHSTQNYMRLGKKRPREEKLEYFYKNKEETDHLSGIKDVISTLNMYVIIISILNIYVIALSMDNLNSGSLHFHVLLIVSHW